MDCKIIYSYILVIIEHTTGMPHLKIEYDKHPEY